MQSVAGLAMGAHFEGDVLVFVAKGKLTPESLQRLRAYAVATFERYDARAVVIDTSAVLFQVGDQALLDSVTDPSLPHVQAPVAYVVCAPAYEPVRGACWLMAERGLIRGLFLARAPAVAWAGARREHWRHSPERPAAVAAG